MKRKTILYIGNNLSKKSKYNSTLTVLSRLLETEGYEVIVSSNKKQVVIRLLAMCFSVIRYRNKADYILIDTFSTLNFYYAYFTSQLARIFKIKYIPILHGGNLPHRIKERKYIAKQIFANAYKNVAPSNYLKVAFEKEGFDTILIPNIVEIADYKFKKRVSFTPRILWVRAFKEIYNPKLAIEVLKKVKEQFIDAKLCMVGPIADNSYKDCFALASALELLDAVEFTGVLPKEVWHQKSTEFDIFINTTNFDNTPVSVMEAMALGLPVVSTNVGGIPYLLKDGVDAILVESNNAEDMSSAIIRIIANDFKCFAINARKKVEGFSWVVNRNKWLKILN